MSYIAVNLDTLMIPRFRNRDCRAIIQKNQPVSIMDGDNVRALTHPFIDKGLIVKYNLGCPSLFDGDCIICNNCPDEENGIEYCDFFNPYFDPYRRG